jgi:hypothetical protein
MLDATQGINGVTETATVPASDSGYGFKGGTNIYHIKSTTESLTLTFTVAADIAVWTDKITNAIKIELSNSAGDDKETATLETLSIDNFDDVNFVANTSRTVSLMVAAGDTTALQPNQRALHSGLANSDSSRINRLAVGASFTLHVDDTRAVISKSGTETEWSLDVSGAASGNYTFNHSGGYIIFTDPTGIIIPWQIEFPGTEAWTIG